MASSSSTQQPQQADVTAYAKLMDLEEIGTGGFGKVYKARHTDWGPVAYKELVVKFINSSDRTATELKQEVSVHIKLRHPNIVTLMAMIFEPQHYGVILEFCSHGDVYKFLQHFPVDWAWKLSLAHDISLGMNYLHTQPRPIIHGDLKVKNILVGDGFRAKISDFGLARWKQYSFEVTHMLGQGGTVTHVPPESWKNINCRRNEKYDIYGYGVLFWELLAHPRRPFENVDSAAIKDHVVHGRRPAFSDIPPEVPEFMKEIIDGCWAQEPINRPMFPEIKDKLYKHLALNKSRVERARIRLQQHECQRSLTGQEALDGGLIGESSIDGRFNFAMADIVSVKTSPLGAYQVVDNSQSFEHFASQQSRPLNSTQAGTRPQLQADIGLSVRTNAGPIEVEDVSVFRLTRGQQCQQPTTITTGLTQEMVQLMDTSSSTLTDNSTRQSTSTVEATSASVNQLLTPPTAAHTHHTDVEMSE